MGSLDPNQAAALFVTTSFVYLSVGLLKGFFIN